jgi:uncharacterized protein
MLCHLCNGGAWRIRLLKVFMKNLIMLVFVTLVVYTARSQGKNFIDQPYIEVSGAADTLVMPDEIYLRIILSEKDTRDRMQVEDLEQQMVTALRQLGIDIEKQLAIADMSSSFKYYLLKDKGVLKSQRYILKVNDAQTATKVLIALEQIGISNTALEGVGYSAFDQMQDEMRAKAARDALKRATTIAMSLGQMVGPALHVTDGTFAPQWNNGNGTMQLQEVVVTAYGASQKPSAPDIAIEKIKISASISAKFALQ